MDKDKFWLEDPSVLLRSFTLIPSREDTIEDKVNAITRIVLIVFVILLITKQKQATLFLVIALTIICLAYYYQKSNSVNKQYNNESNSDPQVERFMAHAGNSEVNKKSKGPPNPRRPYPPALPEDFVVRNQQEREPNLEEDPRESYLVALRRKAEALDREEEIARLESKIANAETRTIDSRYGHQEIFEPDEMEEQQELPERRIYLDVGEEDVDSSSTFYNNTHPERRGFRFGSKKKAIDPRMNPKVDPAQLLINRQSSVYKNNKRINNHTRKSMQNSVYQ